MSRSMLRREKSKERLEKLLRIEQEDETKKSKKGAIKLGLIQNPIQSQVNLMNLSPPESEDNEKNDHLKPNLKKKKLKTNLQIKNNKASKSPQKGTNTQAEAEEDEEDELSEEQKSISMSPIKKPLNEVQLSSPKKNISQNNGDELIVNSIFLNNLSPLRPSKPAESKISKQATLSLSPSPIKTISPKKNQKESPAKTNKESPKKIQKESPKKSPKKSPVKKQEKLTQEKKVRDQKAAKNKKKPKVSNKPDNSPSKLANGEEEEDEDGAEELSDEILNEMMRRYEHHLEEGGVEEGEEEHDGIPLDELLSQEAYIINEDGDEEMILMDSEFGMMEEEQEIYPIYLRLLPYQRDLYFKKLNECYFSDLEEGKITPQHEEDVSKKVTFVKKKKIKGTISCKS